MFARLINNYVTDNTQRTAYRNPSSIKYFVG